MVDLVTRCPRCGAEELRDAWDQVVNGRLEWSVEYRCPRCSDTVTLECGRDQPPPEVRAEILRQRGEFRLRVTPEPQWSRPALLRALRTAGVALDEVRTLADRLLVGDLTGTSGEMELLARRIRPAGLDGTVERQP